MKRPSITWNGLIYYGEVVGFLLAWVGGAILVSQYAATNEQPTDWNQVATVDVSTMDE